MGKYKILGKQKLGGSINISGSKNAVLPILVASVLNNGITTIHNCPKIADTLLTIEILESIGCKTKFEGKSLTIDTKNIKDHKISDFYSSKMRSSILFLGAFLGRMNQAAISLPGGCVIGKRPIDLHLDNIKKLNVSILEEEDKVIATSSKLTGSEIALTYPSVGACENIICCAVLADGVTTIKNAAQEPEIVDLQNFLNSMGADIRGAGSSTIVIKGVEKLHDVEYTVMPDRIVAGTYLVAGAISDGCVNLKNVNIEDISIVIKELEKTGCEIIKGVKEVTLKAPKVLKPIRYLETNPYPDFPTDMQSQFTALLCKANGKSRIRETVFESRVNHVHELIKMGANITLSNDNKDINIVGVPELFGEEVVARDLRAGVSLILAGLCAEGKSVITNSEHIERGYESIEKDLVELGANIIFENAD